MHAKRVASSYRSRWADVKHHNKRIRSRMGAASEDVVPSLAKLSRKCFLAGLSMSFVIIPTTVLSLGAISAEPARAEQQHIVDEAGVFKPARKEALEAKLEDLYDSTGYDIEVLAKNELFRGRDTGLGENLVAGKDKVIFLVDPTSPNVLDFHEGSNVQASLPPAFFIELQARFGNLFAVREEGEAEAASRAIDALVTCLSNHSGCSVVPGVDSERLQLSAALAAGGGIILGSTTGSGWQYGALSSPIWLSLLASYSLIPVYKRDSSLWLSATILAAFAAAALAGYIARRRLLRQSGRA